MKTLLTLALLTLASAALADSPAQIAADYREKAAAALAKVNDTLEKATVPLVAALVKSGDTTGAEDLQAQLKAKIAGEPVLKPQASAANMFKLYDAARIKALEPAQKAAVTRIDSMLASSDGKNLAVVAELGKVRAEVESGRRLPSSEIPFPAEWTYHGSAGSPSAGELTFNKDGSWKIKDTKTQKDGEKGTWLKQGDGAVDLLVNGVIWKMTFDKKSGVIDRPDVGKRYVYPVGDSHL